jgi:leishmanolysin-like peptidase
MNYSFAEQLVWGRGDGCGYVAGSCGGYIKSQKLKDESIAPFCDYLNSPSISKYGCTIDRSAISFCNLRDFNAVIPPEYQYFNSGENFDSNNATLEQLGGSTTVADYCPYQKGFSVDGSCADTSNAPSPGISNAAAQTYGIGSRCIEHDSTWRASDGSFFRATSFQQSGCYQVCTIFVYLLICLTK